MFRPRAAMLTLYGDYVLPRGGEIGIGSLVRLLGNFGLSEQAIRSAVSRMCRSGLLKDVGTRKVVPLINMVDDAEREKLAREAAERALSLSRQFDYVVLACLARRHAPLVAVVAR